MADFRLRVTYAETGRLVMLSHLEIARALERAVRRAGLPYAVSQGFSPHMKQAFGSALPVGVGGLEEIFDVSLTDYVPPEEALARLIHQEPNNQICIINQEIIDRCLCFTEAFLLPKTPAPLVVPGAADTVMQGKYRGVIELLASRLRISADKALDLFYNSDTYKCLTLRNGDLLLKSDLYILDEIIRELQDKQG